MFLLLFKDISLFCFYMLVDRGGQHAMLDAVFNFRGMHEIFFRLSIIQNNMHMPYHLASITNRILSYYLPWISFFISHAKISILDFTSTA